MSGYKQTRDAAGNVTLQYSKMLQNLDDDLMDRLRGVTGGKLDYTNTPNSLRLAAADHIEQLVATRDELEAKLAEVVAVGVRVRDYFTHHSNEDVYAVHDFNEAIAYLKGQKDD
jgi:hypothetical protein